jgi:flagellar hook-basal body complex protein FliE
MAINNISQMTNTFQNYDVKNWSKSIELGSKIDYRNEFPDLNGPESVNTQTFGDFLAQSIAKVNNLQQDADTAMQKLASGKSQNLHETLLAVERADIAFKQMNQVRMKVIDAYREIMKMQV